MSNVDRLRAAYAEYSARTYGFVERDFAEDISWEMLGAPFPPMHSRAEVRGFFETLAQQFAGHAIRVDDTVESGDRLVAFVTHTFTRHDGGTFDVPAVHDWTWRGGQVGAFREIADNLAFAVGSGQIPAEALPAAPA